jgi:hypothetical protein
VGDNDFNEREFAQLLNQAPALARVIEPAYTALAVVERVLSGRFSTGFQTPSMAYGPDFILGVPDVAREDEKSKPSALTGARNMMPAGCTQGSNSPTPE